MTVDDVVSRVGLWWPAAHRDVLSSAADAWDRAAVALDREGDAGLEGATRAGSTWSGAAFDGLAASDLGWPLVLTHDYDMLIATYAADVGVRVFPPGTRSSSDDEHIWG